MPDHRSVIITGAAHGIGAACAVRFAASGDNLILVDSDEEKGHALVARLRAEIPDNEKQQINFVQADIASRLHVHNVMAEALESNGRVDILVNAMVEHFSAPFLDTSEEDFNRVISKNLTGAFLINQAVARQFIRQLGDEQGQDQPTPQPGAPIPAQAIVNIGSVEGVTTHQDHTAFAASQGGLHQLTKAIALSLSPHQIRVNTVGVGAIRGEGEINNPEQAIITPLERLGEPEDVANVVWFLSSSQAAFVTGQTIFVDGGQLIAMRHKQDGKKQKVSNI